MMGIESIQYDEVTVVSITDYLDATTSEEATAYLSAEIDGGHASLVLDLSRVTYLSSAGLRVILASVREARSNGGDVRLAVAQGNVRRVIDLAGLEQIIKIFPTAKEAVASYSAEG